MKLLGWREVALNLQAQKSITLHGQMDLHISFDEGVICTTVYVKLIASDQLLLVCCQLGTACYHPSVQCVEATVTSKSSTSTSDCESDTLSVSDKEYLT